MFLIVVDRGSRGLKGGVFCDLCFSQLGAVCVSF